MAKFIFTWENLRFSIGEQHTSLWKRNEKKRVILDGVSGSAFSGSLLAIMGASGSGKTTLLNVLSGERRGTGVLRINGRVITGKMMRSNSAYLQQKDLFIENLTIYEHLSFMAAMSLKRPKNERLLIINGILKNLNLEEMKHMRIEYLSGGEKKKLSLAAKLLSDPYILFCDEPTTGLDSFSAISVIKILENVVANGKIVFLTVHQPSSQVFDLFDNIILLSANGKIVFQGSKENVKSFFESQWLFCPISYNPADFYIKCIAINSSVDEMRVEKMAEAFKDYVPKFNFSDIPYNGLLLKYRENDKNFFFELCWLTWRIFVHMSRNLRQYITTFLLIMLTAFIIVLIYSNVTQVRISGAQSIQGALLLIVSELIFNQMYHIIYTFPGEVDIFIHEKNLYSALPYFLSKLVSLVPFSVIHSLGFLIFYFLCLPFLGSLKLFLEMYLILVITSLGGSALGLCLSALFPTVESINLFIVPLQLICLTLSGLWIKITTLPKFFSVLKYVSPFYVSYESICIVYWSKIDEIGNCTTKNQDLPCFENGTEVLQNFDFIPSYSKVYKNLFYLVILITAYCYIGYIGILRKRALYHI